MRSEALNLSFNLFCVPMGHHCMWFVSIVSNWNRIKPRGESKANGEIGTLNN